MTQMQLVEIMQAPEMRCALFVVPLSGGMEKYAINTLARRASFLGTIGHESGGLKYTSEIWGPTPAQKGYEGRKDLGNTEPGDGSRFRGRALIQITGRSNYAQASRELEVDYVHFPAQLAEPRDAAIAACWWWSAHGCNELADTAGFEAVTRRVNGGLNGMKDRLAYYERALRVLTPDFSNVQAGSETTAP